MKTKKKRASFLLMAMMLLGTSFSMVSCSDLIDAFNDNPVNPVPDAKPVSAVDKGKWNLTAEDMDTSVRPGDDFFMYCDGGYWERTVVNESAIDFEGMLYTEVPKIMDNRMKALSFPTKEKLMGDAAIADSADIQKRLADALGCINAITTPEEAWQLTAQLMKEGYNTPFELDINVIHGQVGVMLATKKLDADYSFVLSEPDKKSLQWRLLTDPDLLACMRPLRGSATRAFATDEWPMLTTIFSTLGFSLEDVYTSDAISGITAEKITEAVSTMKQIQEMDVEKWKEYLTQSVTADTVLIDPVERESKVEYFADKYLRYESSRIFSDAYVTSEMKQHTLDYCMQLRQTFRERIAQNEWLSEGSKQKAIEKLDAMTFNIGSPDEWFPEGFADISDEPTLIDDIMALRRTNLALNHRLVGMPVSKAGFHVIICSASLTSVNAFYGVPLNAMNIYPAWMMDPLYNPLNNDAHNYATISTFGHEITHGFDTTGSKYNKDGEFEDIWTSDNDRQEYTIRTQQLIDCYNGFEVMPWSLPGLYNDGAYTIGENIADLGGFLLAYESYKKHLVNQGFLDEELRLQLQRFYLAYANLWRAKYSAPYTEALTSGTEDHPDYKDVHSLSRERVNGVVMNTDDWYYLFPIAATDKLYRAAKDRVRIW